MKIRNAERAAKGKAPRPMPPVLGPGNLKRKRLRKIGDVEQKAPSPLVMRVNKEAPKTELRKVCYIKRVRVKTAKPKAPKKERLPGKARRKEMAQWGVSDFKGVKWKDSGDIDHDNTPMGILAKHKLLGKERKPKPPKNRKRSMKAKKPKKLPLPRGSALEKTAAHVKKLNQDPYAFLP